MGMLIPCCYDFRSFFCPCLWAIIFVIASSSSGPEPHTDLEPPAVIASEARRSIVEKSGFMDCHTTFAMTDGSWKASSSGPEPHTDLEPPAGLASEAWRSIVEKSGFMDCHTTFAMTDGSWRAQRGDPSSKRRGHGLPRFARNDEIG